MARPKKESTEETSNTTVDKKAAAKKALAEINKKFEKGTIALYSDWDASEAISCIPSGSISLDKALGRGGYPRGRIVEILGWESCLSGDTFIRFIVTDRETGKVINQKGGTLKQLWNRFHEKSDRAYPPTTPKGQILFSVASMNDEGRIFSNNILDVVATGEKTTYTLVTEDGNTIRATGDHKFYTGQSYAPLESLSVGDTIYIHNNTPYTVSRDEQVSKRRRYEEIFVKAHPIAATKIVEKKYVYKRLRLSRAVMEAHLNSLSLADYVDLLNSHKLEGLVFLSRDQHVHHLDEDISNNSIENLQVISATEHGKLHAQERHNNLRFMVVPTRIRSIEPYGVEPTFDIKMADPYHNFVANKFVVHNCGKSTTALHAVAETQKLGGLVAYIDAEHALDPEYAEKLGVNMDDVALSQPDNGEQALQIVEDLLKSNAFDLIVVDSVAALVPQKELEGEMGASVMGSQARLLSQGLRKITGAANKSKCVVLFINQLRQKIGVMYGDPTTTTGGNALKFYASVRMQITKGKPILKGETVIGNDTKIKVIKNKVAPPFRTAEFRMLHGVGVDRTTELLNYAIDHKIIETNGKGSFNYGELNLPRGKDNTLEFIRNDPALTAEIEKKVYSCLHTTVTQNEATSDQEEDPTFTYDDDGVVDE